MAGFPKIVKIARSLIFVLLPACVFMGIGKVNAQLRRLDRIEKASAGHALVWHQQIATELEPVDSQLWMHLSRHQPVAMLRACSQERIPHIRQATPAATHNEVAAATGF